jgi:hypothetical protein
MVEPLGTIDLPCPRDAQADSFVVFLKVWSNPNVGDRYEKD